MEHLDSEIKVKIREEFEWGIYYVMNIKYIIFCKETLIGKYDKNGQDTSLYLS